MDQIFSVIQRCLPLCFPLPESEDQNEACQVVGVEEQNEDEEAAEATSEEDYDLFGAAAIANREAWAEVVIARCEVASLNDGFQWNACGGSSSDYYREYYYRYKEAPDCPVGKELNHGCHGVGARNPFPRLRYWCYTARGCPVSKEVQRCLDEPYILVTWYEGTHNHPLPGRGATAMASTALSDGTSSFTQVYLPHHASYLINQSSHPPNIRSIKPDDPSKGIVVDLTINSYDPPQFPMPKSPVQDQDQNQAPKILVGEDSKKDVQSNSITISTSFSRLHSEYDVFLSFRGKDTRMNFTDHLYSNLKRVEIRTFRDDDELPRGKSIFAELVNGIRRSMIFIVIFSKDYASSKWCLDELAEFMDCQNTDYTVGHTLLPIFYHVDPLDVRKQIGTFAEAFARHEEQFHMERVNKWRGALTKAGNCAGWNVDANRSESEVIDEIVREVLCKVNPARLHVAKYPIGMESRVQEIKDLLNLGTRDVRIVGIYGMGGIGKTTLAKAVYNEIHDAFDGSSFLFDLKESSETHNGIAHLQKQLLHDILKTKLKIGNFDRGISIIEERIHGKKVLVILDDVADFENLHKLVKKERLGPGSRIIVTTRDENVLSSLRADKKYEVKELNYWESLRLFSFHAFNKANPKEEYSELSNEALVYAGGIPLALEHLGSFLKVKSIDQWKSTLEKLRRTPLEKIQNILRISFDALDVDTKNIFLDIACFFVGMDKDKDYVIQILDGCQFFPNIGISTLTERSLLTIDCENKFRMHGLIQDMGREIIRKKPEDLLPTLPGERSRLWFHKDVLNVLRNHTGTIKVEGLVLKGCEDECFIKTKAFTNMKLLRLLQINAVHLEGSYEHLSEELIWLCWHECPLEFLPHNFHLESLVVLDMQCSNVKQVWKNNKILNKLKVLNLSNSKRLTKSPDFSQVLKLEILILEGCSGLVEIHESIGGLQNLVLLNLKGCKSLKNLPSSISKLESLKTFDLSDCLEVDKLPDQIGNMMDLIELLADGIAIKQLPSSFGLLKNLEIASLSGCKEQPSKSWVSPLLSLMSPKSCSLLLSSLISSKNLNPVCFLPPSVSGLRSLTKLYLSGRNLSEHGFPVDFVGLSSLQFLDLSRNNFCNLPDCIGRLPKLHELLLHECTSLQSISGLFASVCLLDMHDCTSMERLSILSNHKRGQLVDLRNCSKLTEIQGLENWEFASMHSKGCYSLAYDFRSHYQCPSTIGDDESRMICLPGSEVPNWFTHQGIGSWISFHVPPISKGQFFRLLVCAICAFHSTQVYTEFTPYVSMLNKTRGNWTGFSPTLGANRIGTFHTHSFFLPRKEDHFFLFLTPLTRNKYELESGVIFNELVMESGDEIEVYFRMDGARWGFDEVKKCGIHLIVDEPNVM